MGGRWIGWMIVGVPACFSPAPPVQMGGTDGESASSSSAGTANEDDPSGAEDSGAATAASASSAADTTGAPSSTDEGTAGGDASGGETPQDSVLVFDGTSRGETVPLPGLPNQYTIEYWIRTDGELHGVIVSTAEGRGEDLFGWYFYHEQGDWTSYQNVLVFIDYDTNPWDYVVDPTLDINQYPGWHHVAVTKTTDGLVRMFFDGSAVAQVQFANPFAVVERALRIGSHVGGGVPLFGAKLDDLRISRTVRYDAAFVPPEELVADADTLYLWTFDEGSGTQAIDAVRNAVIELVDPIWEVR